MSIGEKLHPLFEKVFKNAPTAGQYNYKHHPDWAEYYKALCAEKETVRGVVIARGTHSGVWQPSYHYVTGDPDYTKLYNHDGLAMHSYVEIK